MKINPILLSDSYKQFHQKMYPDDLTLLYSNMTPRQSRLGTDRAVWFGLQYYILEYLNTQWNEEFFEKPLGSILSEYKRFHKYFSGVDMETSHISALHKLGYLPLEIKALPEGTLVPMRVPFFTIKNTHPEFAWLVNFLETAMSTVIWDLTTVATISHQYRKLFDKYALESTGSTDFVQWQGHDFSMRGRSSIESSFNQAGHLLSFTGSDTIPAVMFLQNYYGANMEKELIAGSVPASEHSVMMCGGEEGEIETFEALLDKFPTGIISIVSDTWDLWKVCTEYLPKLKDKIMARDGKVVIRPDSGDPIKILTGYVIDKYADAYVGSECVFHHGCYYTVRPTNNNREGWELDKELSLAEVKGVIQLLYEVFGGAINDKGYKILDPHIGVIYGDSITLDRADNICRRLMMQDFASTNWVAGIGSYTFNYNTRDSLGIAVKATFCERNGVGKEIFKDPVTDNGVKKSAKGLLTVTEDMKLLDRRTWEEEKSGMLRTVFKDGQILNWQRLSEIRAHLAAQAQSLQPA